MLTSQFLWQFLGRFWEQFLRVYLQTVQYWVFFKWLINFIANYSLLIVFTAGFQPESNRQWNETNLALLKPYSSPLREVKAAGNFWPRRLFPFESYWKLDLLKKEMEPGNSSSCYTYTMWKKPFKAMKISESIIAFIRIPES